MNCDRFLTLLATMVGVVGSLFLAKGAFGLTPDIMARLAETGWGFNGAQVSSLAAQKANAVCGVILVLLAFLINLVRLALVDEKTPCFGTKEIGFVMAGAATFILWVIFLFINHGIRDHQKHQIGLVITGRHLDDIIQSGKVGPGHVKDLRITTEKLLALNLSEREDDEEFFKKIVQLTGRNLPNTFDFSQLQRGEQPTQQ